MHHQSELVHLILLLFFDISNVVVSDRTAKDLAYCERIASNIKSTTDLPPICQHYPSVIESVKQKYPPNQSSDPQDIAFQGMRPGAAIQARRSRASGIESDAKLKRRLTSSGQNHHWQPQKTKA